MIRWRNRFSWIRCFIQKNTNANSKNRNYSTMILICVKRHHIAMKNIRTKYTMSRSIRFVIRSNLSRLWQIFYHVNIATTCQQQRNDQRSRWCFITMSKYMSKSFISLSDKSQCQQQKIRFICLFSISFLWTRRRAVLSTFFWVVHVV